MLLALACNQLIAPQKTPYPTITLGYESIPVSRFTLPTKAEGFSTTTSDANGTTATAPEIQFTPTVPPRTATPTPTSTPGLGYYVELDVTYCTVDGVALKMDLYRSKGKGFTLPAVIYVHGGGWTGGDKNNGILHTYLPALLDQGYLVASINYRLAPQHKFPAQIEDVKCAVRFLRANAETYGLYPFRIGVWGSSAGGHLASLMGVTGPQDGFDGNGGYAGYSSQVQAVANIYGPTEIRTICTAELADHLFGLTTCRDSIVGLASPLYYVSSNASPFLFLHGEYDTVVPVQQSLDMHSALEGAGVSSHLIIVTNAEHGFAPVGGRIFPSQAELIDILMTFFDQYLQ